MNILSHIAGSPKHKSLEHRIFNTTSFFASVVMLLTFTANEIVGFPFAFNIVLLVFGSLFFSIFYFSRFKEYYRFSKAALIILGFLLAPISWHFNQGITGTTTYYFFTFMLLVIVTLNRSKYIFGAFFISYIVLLALAERSFESFVIPFESKEVEYFDFLFSFIITACIFVIGIITLKNSYEQERSRALAQSEENKKQRDTLVVLNQKTQNHNKLIIKQKEKLEELNTTNNKLFSIISHDLRSPLASLETLLQVMVYSKPSEEETDELMAGIHRELQNTSNLLENLLSWAKQQRQGLVLQQSEFVLHGVVESTFAFLAEKAKNKGISLHNNTLKSVLVRADSNMIRLVLRNLLSNATKFASEGDKIIVNTRDKDGKIIIEIRDTGQGIAEEYQHKIFNDIEFTQRGTNNEKGSGLGLMLCKEFVEQHNEKIWFTSKLGEGTSFFFSLPLVQPNA